MTLGHRRSSKLLFDSELDSLSPSRRRKIVAMRDRFDRILRRILIRGNETGQLIAVDEKLAAIAIVSIVARARLWFSPRGSISREDFVTSVTEMVLNGLKPRV